MKKWIPMLAATAMLALPSAALAYECNYGKERQAMSCAPGTSFDQASGTCVADATG